MTESAYNTERCRLLSELKMTPAEINLRQENTVGQWDKLLYIQTRSNRLTASGFHTICSRKKTTNCRPLIGRLLNTRFTGNEATRYGKNKESVVRDMFQQKNSELNVQECGIFVCHDHPHLAATPDGIVDENAVLEIKCFYKASKDKLTIRGAIAEIKSCPLEIHNDVVRLKRNHSYYYQILGQMNICNRDRCYFVVYIDDETELFVEIIERDEEFWKETLEKLNSFYFNCYLPRLVDPKRNCAIHSTPEEHPIPGPSSSTQ